MTKSSRDTDNGQGEWRKGKVYDMRSSENLATLLVPRPDGEGDYEFMHFPEWVIDRIIADHAKTPTADTAALECLACRGTGIRPDVTVGPSACGECGGTGLVSKLETAVKALREIGWCSRCKGDGSPQRVTCDDYQYCRCNPGEGRYADKCWACGGTGISNRTARDALRAIEGKGV